MTDPRLTPISDIIKSLEDEITEAQWEGDFQGAQHLEFKLKHLKQLQQQGELYVPDH